MRPIRFILHLFLFVSFYSCDSSNSDRSEKTGIGPAQADTATFLKDKTDTNLDSGDSNPDLDIIILKSLATELKSKDPLKIRNITSEKGYISLLKWSDSFKDKSFIIELARNIEEYKGDEKFQIDSKLTIPLGKPDAIVGATGGYIVLLKIDKKIVIDQFLGGK